MLHHDSPGKGPDGEGSDRRGAATRHERRVVVGYLVCLLLLGSALVWGILNCGC